MTMNMRALTVALASLTMLMASACVPIHTHSYEEYDDGEGGDDGDGGTGGTGGDGGTGGTGGDGGTGGAGGADTTACVGCGEYVTEGGTLCLDNGPDPADPAGSSADIAAKYLLCLCGDDQNTAVDSPCGLYSTTDNSCGDNLCAGKSASFECYNCMNAAYPGGACADTGSACMNDIF
jgi:hypothetical protein